MLLHRSSGHWQLGLTLSLLTAFLWGVMPNVLAIALQALDTYTLTWFRFLSSFVLLAGYLMVRRAVSLKQAKDRFPPFRLKRSGLILLAIATLGVGLDYPLYLQGLARTSPANAEVVIQLAPVLLGLGAIVIFKERYSRSQWAGLGVLTLGFVLFFHEQLQSLVTAPNRYLLGSSLVMLASVSWAIYALAQKQLLQQLPSEQVMLIIYGACTLLYSPIAVPQKISELSPLYLGILLCCGLSTLISYGAFAESLEHWEASKISAVQSLTPIVTMGSGWVLSGLVPSLISAERISLVGLLGAVLVIVGSMGIALGQGDRSD
jgi:drug/metabolite transporter (DMT)-like permease